MSDIKGFTPHLWRISNKLTILINKVYKNDHTMSEKQCIASSETDSPKVSGFTLVELLIYTSIFAIVGVTLTSIFVIFLRIDIKETAGAEISNQANFILQRIQNYISNAGFLVVNDDGNDEVDGLLAAPHSKLIIKDRAERSDQTTSNDSFSPIVIYKEGDSIKVRQGQGDASYITNDVLNSEKIKVTGLAFTKMSSHPGRDSVTINLTLEYNNPSLPQKLSRSFILGVGKASAAVFDTSLQSGTSTPAQLDIGTATNPWRNLFLAGNLTADGTASVIKLGSNSNSFAYLRNGELTVNPPSMTASSTAIVTITTAIDPDVSGFVAGDRIFLTPPTAIENGLVFVGATTGANSVNIKIRNSGGATIDGAALSWYFWLVR